MKTSSISKLLIRIAIVSLSVNYTNATGMAVSLNNLYLQNTTSKIFKLKINNLDKNTPDILLAANSMCKINKNIMFLPSVIENNNFVIMLSNANMVNPIVIDKDSSLSLANLAKLKFRFSGDIKNYNFLGYCNNNLTQSKSLSVMANSNSNELPNFNLKNCDSDSNFVYVINQSKTFVPPSVIDFSKVKLCNISK